MLIPKVCSSLVRLEVGIHECTQDVDQDNADAVDVACWCSEGIMRVVPGSVRMCFARNPRRTSKIDQVSSASLSVPYYVVFFDIIIYYTSLVYLVYWIVVEQKMTYLKHYFY
jgi:hypothetical protein